MQDLVQELQRHFGQQISVLGEQSGLYVLVKIKSPLSERPDPTSGDLRCEGLSDKPFLSIKNEEPMPH